MTRLLWVFIFFNLTAPLSAQGKITVTVFNFENNKGACKTCLYANAVSFAGKSEAFKCIETQINNKKTTVVFNSVPAGVYAIAVFHDANNNNKFDKNSLGIPKEGYGASKNKLPFASAPTFRENKFQVTATSNLQLYIRLRNL